MDFKTQLLSGKMAIRNMNPVHKNLHARTHTLTFSRIFALHNLSAIRLCGSYSTRSDQYLPPLPTLCHCPEAYSGEIVKGIHIEKKRQTENGEERRRKRRIAQTA